ncbi:MAG: acetyl-CoA carboxylase, carboxyltransferase subunit beta [Candidatus Omnitrophica bacterium]|nr:acetyl-CoA carboxylase, carboxyltransferase subunit beta [Candidatus Omnitrophota bacterium]MBU4487459.1 acetyl-CoA carboxylase, carboxyltransferase subunit beta [Candidatus Omnitrophota bacterium]MCG2705105.1 acetyl-CoA carboxylase, carboxyltransferase subunit beta [Candidatus Omnitrophota bacterium]
MALFGKPRYTIVKVAKKRQDIPEGLWTKCGECGEIAYNKKLEENLKVCPKCNYHFKVGAYERIDMLLDKNTFKEIDKNIQSKDPLNFKGPKKYKDKLEHDKKATGLKDAVVCGEGKIEEKKLVLAVTDSRFIMGSMGSVVGEKITRAIEKATREKLPVVICSGSGGGARMYEGMFSLMQMVKTSAAVSKHNKAGLLFISLLTNPTMAGVMASFASLGDVIMAEPKALIGFTGPRVIEQTIRQRLPHGFQQSEFMLEHGLIDMVVHRKDLRSTISGLMDYLS